MVDEGLKEYVSATTLARLFGLTTSRINQLAEEKVIDRIEKEEGRGYIYETVPTIKKYIQFLSDRSRGRDRTNKELELKEQKLRAEVALKESQGELHRLRTEIAQGNYVSVEEVKADYSRFFIVFKNFALSIPGKMAGRLSGFVEPVEVREIENELQKEVNGLLSDFVSRAVVKKPQVEDVTKPKKRGRPPKNAKKKL